ncbi:MAG: TetR/AcrR family transcriptional regulator [Gemmatimonadaceae bacterium]|nr:TetR/AcrR family transcriptional regulator [Gemmatimonadaceae bacterium]
MAGTARHHTSKAKPAGVRERMLDAAIATLREHGLQKLTQLRVAKRARVRQSHLTYYFPTRDDLLEAVATRAVDEIARHAGAVTGTPGDQSTMLTRLASAVADSEHMRMFVGLIVEADEVPAVRSRLVKGTQQIEAALAAALGGDGSMDRARIALAAIWGLGLYRFLVRPASKAEPARSYLSWLGEATHAPRARRAGRKRVTRI